MKYIITILASFLIVSVAYAFKPATLFIETWSGIKRQAVYTEKDAEELFKKGYKLYREEPNGMLGTSITTINGSDTLKDSRTTINDNFTALNNGKIEISTTSLPLITSLAGLTTVGTITSGSWNATAISVSKGGTGTTSPTRYLIPIGDGANGYVNASSTGTSGQFLTSNGAGVYPSWQSATVNQTADYTWTGTHIFATTTAASSTITNLNLNGQNANSLTSLATSTLHWHPKTMGTSMKNSIGMQTITHNLGVIPSLIEIDAMTVSTTTSALYISNGFSTSATSTQQNVYAYVPSGGTATSTGSIVNFEAGSLLTGTLWTVSATNFVINWTGSNMPIRFTWRVEY